MKHLYVITRKDLSPGYQAVQSTHAALDFLMEHREAGATWHAESNFLCLLSVPDEASLEQLAQEAQRKCIRFTIFREPDIDNQVTAIALEPGTNSAKLCRKLDLALKEL